MSSEGLQRRTSSNASAENIDNASKDNNSAAAGAAAASDRRWWGSMRSLAVAVSVPLILGIIDAMFNNPRGSEFYRGLKKPWWNPGGWVFGVAWSLIYPAMGLASWLVWRRGGLDHKAVLGLYMGQLIVNLLWPFLFFGLHSIKLALFDIIALDFLVFLCIQSFHAIDPLASTLFKPYLAWVAFATLLNFTLLTLN